MKNLFQNLLKPKKLKNKELFDTLLEVEKSEGYLIMITTLDKNDRLTHTYFTKTFRKGDMIPSLDEHHKLLQPEIESK